MASSLAMARNIINNDDELQGMGQQDEIIIIDNNQE
jgi:hypothetical protein